jgi:malate dehydrogenase (oxaloacetate-decarboxylating)(NADP+)
MFPLVIYVVVGSRILGLGDLGVNGMPISIGKLSLYIAGAGSVFIFVRYVCRPLKLCVLSIRPASTVPICIDVGTDNKKFLEDPLYLGLRQPRIPEAEMNEFMEEFMHEMSVVFPDLLIQFEDFSTDKVSRVMLNLLVSGKHCMTGFCLPLDIP